MRQLLCLIVFVMVSMNVIAAEPGVPLPPARVASVKCAPTINVWIEVDNNSLPARQPTKTENRKRVSFNLIDSMTYRGDAVLCNYATRRRDVTTSYSVQCLRARKERGYKHSYLCGG